MFEFICNANKLPGPLETNKLPYEKQGFVVAQSGECSKPQIVMPKAGAKLALSAAVPSEFKSKMNEVVNLFPQS